MLGKHVFAVYKRFSFLSIIEERTTRAPHSAVFSPFSEHIYEDLVHQFLSILRDCSEVSSLSKGRQIHGQIVTNGLGNHNILGEKILGMYVLCRSMVDAKNLFFTLKKQYTLPWNWMIRGFTMTNHFEFALLFYFKMFSCGIFPDNFTFPCVIKSCSRLSLIDLGRLIHDTISSMGYEMDIIIASALIKMYADNSCIYDARRLFDKLPLRDSVLWNVMINGYMRNGDMDAVFELFTSMRNSEINPNSVTFASVLSLCGLESRIKYGTQLHGLVLMCGLDFEPSVANTLLSMYAKCCCLSNARKLFDLMPQTDLVTWNCLIAGYVQNGFMMDALYLFYEMQSTHIRPDSITLASFLPSLSDASGLRSGKEVHGYIIRNNVHLDAFLKNSLIDLYFKCRDVEMAYKVFNSTNVVDLVICSAMISGYVLNGMSYHAFDMFRWLLQVQMKPNAITLASVLPACSSLTALKLGKELHAYSLKNAFDGKCYVASSLIDMYAKCGRLDLARHEFDKSTERDVVLWNTMITSYSQNGQPEDAISLLREMGFYRAKCDCVTISAALSACANLPARHYGKEIHGYMTKGSLRTDIFVESALIDMYSKCGDLLYARNVFDSMHEKNEVSWNSMISAYGTHGHLNEAVIMLGSMRSSGIFPDHVTFLAIISACSHAGEVDKGFNFFQYMVNEYRIEPRMEHFACMVDLFGRAGRLDEALSFITSMPFKPDAGIWGALLGACRVHGNVELADLASKHLFKMEPQNSGYYVLYSNVNALGGRWNNVLKVRSLMKERGVQKLPGCSWIEINSTNHMFIASDKNHPQSEQIYLCLVNLIYELRKEGYVPKIAEAPSPMDSD